jgi:hypothetical protein
MLPLGIIHSWPPASLFRSAVRGKKPDSYWVICSTLSEFLHWLLKGDNREVQLFLPKSIHNYQLREYLPKIIMVRLLQRKSVYAFFDPAMGLIAKTGI